MHDSRESNSQFILSPTHGWEGPRIAQHLLKYRYIYIL
jgi:hypothetical protein